MITLAHYFTTRHVPLSHELRAKLEATGEIEPDESPLYLPKHSVRILLSRLSRGWHTTLRPRPALRDAIAIALGLGRRVLLGITVPASWPGGHGTRGSRRRPGGSTSRRSARSSSCWPPSACNSSASSKSTAGTSRGCRTSAWASCSTTSARGERPWGELLAARRLFVGYAASVPVFQFHSPIPCVSASARNGPSLGLFGIHISLMGTLAACPTRNGERLTCPSVANSKSIEIDVGPLSGRVEGWWLIERNQLTGKLAACPTISRGRFRAVFEEA